jgi:hypothetical protein
MLTKDVKIKKTFKTLKTTIMNILKTIVSKTAIILLILSIAVSSCSSDDDSSDSGQGDYFLTAKIDGVNYSRDFVTVSNSPDVTDVYIISGVGDGSSIGLTLESPISTGTFSPTAGRLTVLFYQENDPFMMWGATEDAGSGTITITANNATSIEGTFSFTGINPIDDSTKVITEGKFKAQKL